MAETTSPSQTSGELDKDFSFCVANFNTVKKLAKEIDERTDALDKKLENPFTLGVSILGRNLEAEAEMVMQELREEINETKLALLDHLENWKATLKQTKEEYKQIEEYIEDVSNDLNKMDKDYVAASGGSYIPYQKSKDRSSNSVEFSNSGECVNPQTKVQEANSLKKLERGSCPEEESDTYLEPNDSLIKNKKKLNFGFTLCKGQH